MTYIGPRCTPSARCEAFLKQHLVYLAESCLRLGQAGFASSEVILPATIAKQEADLLRLQPCTARAPSARACQVAAQVPGAPSTGGTAMAAVPRTR
jgi:hypothetical protein